MPRYAFGWRRSLCVLTWGVGWLVALVGCGAMDAKPAEREVAQNLADIESKVFSQSCVFSSCHGGPTPRDGLSLVPPTYGRIVNQPARAVAGRVLVAPGDPGASYLLEKIANAHPTAGEQMPPKQPLDATAIHAIRGWIEAGALLP
jgi:hypothetical protein